MKEIIIDDINVEGCEFYDNGSCRECDMRVPFYSDIDCYDKCNKECYYKQLKRLEQENAELKERLESYNCNANCYKYKEANKYKQALEEIRGMCKKVAFSNGCDNCDGIGFYDGCLDDDCGNYACFKTLDKINEVLND